MYLQKRSDDFYWWYNSNIKVGLKVVAFFCRYCVLGVEDDVFWVLLNLEEVNGLLFHMVVIHHEKILIHSGWEIVMLFDSDGKFFFHYVCLTAFLFLWLGPGEILIHFLLFFSSILHNLEVTGEGWGATGTWCCCEADALYLSWRNVFELIYLIF